MWDCLYGLPAAAETPVTVRNYRDLISKPVKELVDSGRALMFAGKNDSAYILYLAAINLLFRQNVGRGKELCELACNNAGHISSFAIFTIIPRPTHLHEGSSRLPNRLITGMRIHTYMQNLGNLLCYNTGRWEGMAHQVKSIEAACAMGDTAMYPEA